MGTHGSVIPRPRPFSTPSPSRHQRQLPSSIIPALHPQTEHRRHRQRLDTTSTHNYLHTRPESGRPPPPRCFPDHQQRCPSAPSRRRATQGRRISDGRPLPRLDVAIADLSGQTTGSGSTPSPFRCLMWMPFFQTPSLRRKWPGIANISKNCLMRNPRSAAPSLKTFSTKFYMQRYLRETPLRQRLRGTLRRKSGAPGVWIASSS